jgi:MFS family permease
MSSATYRTLLRTPGAAAFFLPAAAGRVGIAMTSLGIVWLVHARTGSYATAGLVTGGFAVAEAVAGPQLARLTDRYGQGRVLPPALLAHAAAVAAQLALVAAGLAAGCLPLLAAGSPLELGCCLALTGVAIPLILVLCTVLAEAAVHRTVLTQAFVWLNSASAAGSAAGAAAAGWAVGACGARAGFAVAALAAGVLAVLAVASLRAR